MGPNRLALLAALVLLSGSLPAQVGLAQVARAAETGGCANFKWPIDRERSAFAAPGLQTIEDGKPLPGIMDAAIVKLKPVADSAFARTPGHKPKEGTFGTVLKTPPIAVAGTYQITLSDEAWIDVLQDGHEVRSSAFSGGKDCPSVRKSVRFPLKAGDATVQISGSASDSIKVDLLPAQ